MTIDSPIPYDLDSLINIIKDERDKLTASKQDSHNSILDKIDVLEIMLECGF